MSKKKTKPVASYNITVYYDCEINTHEDVDKLVGKKALSYGGNINSEIRDSNYTFSDVGTAVKVFTTLSKSKGITDITLYKEYI